MPSVIQLHLSWADEQVVKDWSNGGMPFPKADIRDYEEFGAMAKQVSIENDYVDLGFDEVYAHDECVIPKLHLPEMG
jgi:hypothetical protein